MMNYLPPVLFVALAVGAFSLYISPTYTDIQLISEDIARYDDALNSSKELMKIRDDLVTRYNSFTPEDLQRLNKMLPEKIDNVRLIIDIDALAAQYGMRLTNITVAESAIPTQTGEELGPDENPHLSVDIGFTTTSSYSDFRKFLRALETSLRLVDVKSLSFTASAETPTYTYSVLLSSYWLK